MDYRKALAVLEERQETRIRLGLARIRRHLARLGDPQEKVPAVHVAGTNGKGSVCAMISAIGQAAGLKAGLYISPHLSDPRERIAINGKMISRADFSRLMSRALRHEDKDPLTYFELLTSIAFQYFAERRIELMVLETGLGGRFDATNVVKQPVVSVITTVDYDHMQFLGSSITAIAGEKAGILKRARPVVVGDLRPAALKVVSERARALGCPLLRADRPNKPQIDWRRGRQAYRVPDAPRRTVGLLGVSQPQNAEVAAEAAKQLAITDSAIAKGLAAVRWPGRWQVVRKHGRVAVVDGAHNRQAMERFEQTLRQSPWQGRRSVFIMGFLKDKEHELMVKRLAPHLREAIVVAPSNPRALDAGTLAREVRAAAPKARITVAANPREAIHCWLARKTPRNAFICGSLYLAGEALNELEAA